MTTATISEKGWIVIPAEMRRKYDLRPGAQVMLVDYGGVLAIVPALQSPVQDSAGLVKGGRSLTAALKEERAREQARHEARGRRGDR
ncbi:MAG: AbrB/MazE/SpoVT family DNA-binding domain-containing protein [Anaerolineae bacterium]